MILAYTRVSTTEQAADNATSLAEQARKCKAIADLRGAGPYDFILYSDPGVSGSIPLAERPEGKKLLADAKKDDFIVSSKLDRMFRSASDALNTAERLKKAGINLILTDLSSEPVTANGAAALFFGMLALVAAFERDRLHERMVSGKAAKKKNGGHVAGSAPYGWAVVGVGRESRLVPVEAEQHAIRRIIELRPNYDDGKPNPIGRLIHRLDREKIYSRSTRSFQTVQVKRILERASTTNSGQAQ